MLKTRQLGRSALHVTELGFGTMSLPNDSKMATELLETAFGSGIRFFDTADLYGGGTNEQLLAPFLKAHRHDVVLATKVGNELQPDGSWTWNPTKSYIMDAVKTSLQKLGTDYIDLYQLHGGTMEDHVDETIEAFEALKKEGVIRAYGISSIRPNVIDRFLTRSSAASVMMQYSPLDRRPEEWLPMIQEHGASVITRGTVAKGLLTAHGAIPSKVAKGFVGYTAAALHDTLAQLEPVTDLHAASIQYVLQEEAVATALVGASSVDQLLESVKAYERGATDADVQALRNATQAHQYEAHRV